LLGLKVRTFWQIVIFSFVASSSAYATENCTFSEENISQKQYSDNPAIEVFQWFPKSNEVKGVLSNGHLFSVKHWACHHYGKQAIMLIGPQIASIPRELNKHILQLGKVALSKTEFMLLTNNIENKPFKLADSPITLRIKSKTFDDFYVQINIIGEVILIEVKLYKS
jgi:hypothetical protein